MKNVVFIYANEFRVPYINWFLDRKDLYPDIRFTVIAMYPVEPKLVKDTRERGCEAYWIKYDSSKRKRGMALSFFKIWKLLHKLKPDVLQTFSFDDSLPGLLAGRIVGIKNRIIYKQETWFHWIYYPQWVKFDRFNNFNATSIVATSGEGSQFVIEKEGVVPEKVTVIHPGTDIKELKVQSQEVKKYYTDKYALQGKTVIGTIARFVEWKGYRYIVEAAVKLKRTNPDIRFLFIGIGPQTEDIKKMAKELGVDDIIYFLGWVEESHIPSLFGLMNIYLHSSSKEPFGYIYSEAMLNTTPIVTNETGGAKDFLTHKLNCYFTEPKMPDSIVEGVEWMLGNIEQIQKSQEQTRKIAEENLNVDVMMKKFVSLYKMNG